MSEVSINRPPDNHEMVLDGQGWIGLIDTMGSEITAANAARVSFGKMKTEMDESDRKLIKYLIDNQHMSPFEHISFTFNVHCPLFVRSQWHRHRIGWGYNEISRRYTDVDIEFYETSKFRSQHKSDRQASNWDDTNDPMIGENLGCGYFENKASSLVADHHQYAIELFEQLIEAGICREQARGVLPQNMMTTFWATCNMRSLMHFILLRSDSHAQWEIQEFSNAMLRLIETQFPLIADVLKEKLNK